MKLLGDPTTQHSGPSGPSGRQLTSRKRLQPVGPMRRLRHLRLRVADFFGDSELTQAMSRNLYGLWMSMVGL